MFNKKKDPRGRKKLPEKDKKGQVWIYPKQADVELLGGREIVSKMLAFHFKTLLIEKRTEQLEEAYKSHLKRPTNKELLKLYEEARAELAALIDYEELNKIERRIRDEK